jgi:predicted PurR-regulated permease PerM
MSKLPARTIIKGVLVVLSAIGIFFFFYHFLREIILIFVGIFLGVSMAPAVDFLQKRKVNRSISVILIYLLAVLFFLVFIFLLLPQMAQQVSTLAPKFQDFYSSVSAAVKNSPIFFIRQMAGSLPADLNSFFPNPQPGTGAINSINLTLRVIQTVLQSLFEISVVLLIGFYWTLEGERAKYAFSLLFSAEKRDEVRALVDEIEGRVGGFVRGQGLLALSIGVMVLVAYWIIGLPSVLSLAFAAGLCELIPIFGPTLGAVPAILLALATNPAKVFWVIPVTILLQNIENHFLAPQIMKRTVKVNPIVTILAITAFGYLLGFLGVLMAIPLAAIIQVVLDRSLLRPAEKKIEEPVGRDNLSVLHLETQEFINDIRKLVRKKETGATADGADEVEDAIESIATELDGLLVETLPAEEESQ